MPLVPFEDEAPAGSSVSLVAEKLAAVPAQDCPTGCKAGQTRVEAVSTVAKIEKLEAGAAKGCESSKELLAKLQTVAKVDSTVALKEKVAAGIDYSACVACFFV